MVKISYAGKIYKDLPWENLLNRNTLKHKKASYGTNEWRKSNWI